MIHHVLAWPSKTGHVRRYRTTERTCRPIRDCAGRAGITGRVLRHKTSVDWPSRVDPGVVERSEPSAGR